MVPVSNKLDSFFPSTSTSSTASYKSLPQTPSEAVELGVEELELDIGISSRDLDLQNRHQRQPLLVHQTSQYHRPGSHYPAGLHTLFEEDVKEDEEQRMAAYDPQNDNHFLGTSSEAELVSVPVKEERKGDKLALYIALAGLGTFLIGTWLIVFLNNPSRLGLFAAHPPLQSLAIVCFALGILQLQPTSQPKTKTRGLARHQLVILGVGLPSIIIGTTLVFINKVLHEAPHFTTWHATFGIIAIVWMVIQMLLGGLSVWFGGKAFGGGMKAKKVWRYHRASGYLLFPLFLMTAAIGGNYSSWASSVVNEAFVSTSYARPEPRPHSFYYLTSICCLLSATACYFNAMREKGAIGDSSASIIVSNDSQDSSSSDAAVATATSLIAAEDIHVQPILDQLSSQMPVRLTDTTVGRSQSDVRSKQMSMISPVGPILDIPALDPDASLHESGFENKLRPTNGRLSGDFDNGEENAGLPGTTSVNVRSSRREDQQESVHKPSGLPQALLGQLVTNLGVTMDESQRTPAPPLQPHNALGGYDWPTFITAYAAGRWNPHRIPSAPRLSAASTPATPNLMSDVAFTADSKNSGNSGSVTIIREPTTQRTSQPELSELRLGSSASDTGTNSSTSASDLSMRSKDSASSVPSSTYSPTTAQSPFTPQPVDPVSPEPSPIMSPPPPHVSSSLPPDVSPLTGISHRRASIGSSSPAENAMRIPLPPPSLSSGISSSSHSLYRAALFSPNAHTPGSLLQPLVPLIPTPGSEVQSVYYSASSNLPSGATTPDLATAAATMRWAASEHASLSPLAVPSPEHELTDPMRGVAVALPVDDVEDAEEEVSSDNNGSTKYRWSGYGFKTGKPRVGRRGRYFGKGRTASQTRRIWEKYTNAERQQSSSEETEIGKSDDDSIHHLPSEPFHQRRKERHISGSSQLPTIEASPLASPLREKPSSLREYSDDGLMLNSPDITRQNSLSRSSSVPAPVSTPLLRTASEEDNRVTSPPSDYFGLIVHHSEAPNTLTGQLRGISTKDTVKEDATNPLGIVTEGETTSSLDALAKGNTNSLQLPRVGAAVCMPSTNNRLTVPKQESHSVPNTPMHRGVLNRQTSSPLPARKGHDNVDDDVPEPELTQPAPSPVCKEKLNELPRLRAESSVSVGGKPSAHQRPGLVRAQSMKAVSSLGSGPRATREEEEYTSRGYLIPPHPRDETERRRALYKFNIVHTTPDVNFDRIAYLTKLVFSMKIVVVSLVDGEEEWYKMESGMGIGHLPRDDSFSAHAILQRGDEPTVVLDTRKDWRFLSHPLVAKSPNVRFFAAAPLRTSDGFNIGALCIMDDRPHMEFNPRQRHTLKEFAAIVMREMELWKDKIQLRIRDRIQTSMEQFTRECLEIDVGEQSDTQGVLKAGSMDRVYERAAKLVKKTLDVEGAIVMDVSHFDVLETTKSEGAISIVCHHGDCPNSETPSGGLGVTTTHSIPSEEYQLFLEFFSKFPEGKIAEGIVPRCFRSILPTRIQHALIVPIFNIDKQPFALLCAYNTADHVKPFLEGHELSYLRAIGVIILSAVLKRRMILADKSKSLFISNISHELRTPLHGILAAAELLADTELDDNQASFLRTVQACGTSLVETVNHVLDFTKLSGNSKSGGVENVIHPTKVDLMQLVEEAVEGCWIGYRARLPASSEIGSVYAPPSQGSQFAFGRASVETVIDVDLRQRGWQLICEKGGIRRVMMNLIGNSLKFTSSGYVHITLREIVTSHETVPKSVKVELAVIDTGKGISKEFLKNQLFHPFSQENPLQSGTGLGLAIVNSIVRSESVNGHVDVSSTEGVGTEIRITFDAAIPEDDQPSELEKLDIQGKKPTVSMFGFDEGSRGSNLLRDVIKKYLHSWWGFEIVEPTESVSGDILVLNEDVTLIARATEAKDISRPFVLLTSSRADNKTMSTVYSFEKVGGFCRLVSKPVGPSRLRQVLKACVHIVQFRDGSQYTSSPGASPDITRPLASPTLLSESNCRRLSQESGAQSPFRPRMAPRASTFHPVFSGQMGFPNSPSNSPPQEYPSSPGNTTINIGTTGTLLKSSIGTRDKKGRARILVVEDNQILSDLLTKWLQKKGYDVLHATDGRQGVDIFESNENIDVILVDLSMPVLDGIEATTEIRKIESERIGKQVQAGSTKPLHLTKILALTGMSSLEDKRRAFDAGVDGYLVKPVAFKILNTMFQQLGVS